MGQLQRYLFDVSFDEPDPPHQNGKNGRKPEPTYTVGDLAAARESAFAAGRDAGLAEAAQAAETHAAAALEAIDRNIAALAVQRAERDEATERQAIALLRTVLQKAVPALSRKDPLAEIQEFVVSCLHEALDEPRLVLRVSDALFDEVQRRTAGITQAAGYGGKVVLLAEPALSPGDARVEWADGGAERIAGRFARELDAVLAHALQAPPSCPTEEKPDE